MSRCNDSSTPSYIPGVAEESMICVMRLWKHGEPRFTSVYKCRSLDAAFRWLNFNNLDGRYWIEEVIMSRTGNNR